MKFYKYMNLDTLYKVLRAEGVYFLLNSPSCYNDPFDCTGQVVGIPSTTFTEHYLHGKPQLIDDIRTNKETRAAIVARDFADLMQSRNGFDDLLRVFCMANLTLEDDETSPLMWSHYADGGKGVRLTIDLDGTNINPQPIRYSFSPPILDLSSPRFFNGDEPSIEKFCLECVFTKSLAWSYEREWRIIFPITDLPMLQHLGIKITIENDKYFWNPRRSVITRIDFGQQVSENDVVTTVTQLSRDGYKNLDVRVARKNGTYRYMYECHHLTSGSNNPE